jgi:hypothetical protein
MVSQCLNPQCRAAFLYLRQGKLFAVRAGHLASVEFFWLCDSCTTNFTIDVAPDGNVRLVPIRASSNRAISPPGAVA